MHLTRIVQWCHIPIVPLQKSCSLEAFRANVQSEIASGKTPEQAAAIAHDILRKACKDAGKPIPRTDSVLDELGVRMEMVQRYDFTPLGKPRKTSQGFLRFPANLTRVGVLTYRKADGTIQRELRPPEEVFDAQSLETLSGAPVTDLHTSMVNPSNVRQLSMGIVGESVRHDGKFVQGHVTIQDQELIDKVTSGERREGSPGYNCFLDRTPGNWEGEKYDAVQRNIRYNHWGIGPENWGRQGNDVALRLDGGAAASFVNPTPATPGSTVQSQEKAKMKIRIDGIDYELDSEAAKQAIDKAIEKRDSEAVLASEKNSELQGKYDAVVKGKDELKKKLDEANDPKRVDALVESRADLLSKAREVLGKEEKLDGLTARQVKVKVLQKIDEKFDDTGKVDAYIDGLFDHTIQNHEPESREDGISSARKASPSSKSTTKTDGKGDKDEIDKYDAGAAEERMIARNSEAWKEGLEKAN